MAHCWPLFVPLHHHHGSQFYWLRSAFDWKSRRGNMANVNSPAQLWCIHSLCCQFLGMVEGGPNLANHFGWHAPYAKQLATQLPFFSRFRAINTFEAYISIGLGICTYTYIWVRPSIMPCSVPASWLCLIGCAVLQFMLLMRPHPPPTSSDSFVDSTIRTSNIAHVAHPPRCQQHNNKMQWPLLLKERKCV